MSTFVGKFRKENPMSKKKPVYVEIPVGHVCVKIDYLQQKQTCIEVRERENYYLRRELYKVQDENENLKKKLSDAEAKIEELEKERTRLDKESLDWYRKYASLRDKYELKHNAVKPDAETKET